MSHSVSSQHPAVVLRSHYQHVRALLAVAMIAVVGLTLALVLVASNSGGSTTVISQPARTATPTVFNGGHDEGNAGLSTSATAPNERYDGGIEEGIAGH
jgi:hypothetical protein